MKKEYIDLLLEKKYKDVASSAKKILDNNPNNTQEWYALFVAENKNYIGLDSNNIKSYYAYENAINLSNRRLSEEYISEFEFYKALSVDKELLSLIRYAQLGSYKVFEKCLNEVDDSKIIIEDKEFISNLDYVVFSLIDSVSIDLMILAINVLFIKCSIPKLTIIMEDLMEYSKRYNGILVDYDISGSVDDVIDAYHSFFEKYHNKLSKIDDSLYEIELVSVEGEPDPIARFLSLYLSEEYAKIRFKVNNTPSIIVSNVGINVVTDIKDKMMELGAKINIIKMIEKPKNTDSRLYNVILLDAGSSLLKTLGYLKEVMNCDLLTAKEIARTLPRIICKDIDLLTAENVKKTFESHGCDVEIAFASGELSGDDIDTVGTFGVELVSHNGLELKIALKIKAIMGFDKSVSEVKELINNLPFVVKDGLTEQEALRIKEQLELVGCKVRVTSSKSKEDLNELCKIALDGIGSDKLSAIRLVMQTCGWGLKESKEFVEKLPNVMLTDISVKDAKEIKKSFEKIGCFVSILNLNTEVVAKEIKIKEVKEINTSGYKIKLVKVGTTKLGVVRVIKESFKLGLKDSNDLTNEAPVLIPKVLSEEEALKIKELLELEGATVEVVYS